MKKPDIREYKNYRQFLAEMYEFFKETTPYFSYRYFSKVAGFSSPNVLKLVIDGKRSLTGKSIEQFIKALKLNKEESQVFRNLVYLNQAKNLEEKKFYSEQIIKSNFFQRLHPLKEIELDYYSHWYHIVIRELVGTKDFKEDPEWIAQRLEPNITIKEAREALKTLEKLNLISRDEDGKLIQSNRFISTGDEVSSTLVKQFHEEMMKKAVESMLRFSKEERDISSLSLSLSAKGKEDVKNLIQDFRKQLLTIAEQDLETDEVYQVNFQFFPLTKMGPRKE